MRKVELTMKEQNTYQTIKNLVDTHGNKKRAALKLNCSLRTIDRKIAQYKATGKQSFSHGNKIRQPQHSLAADMKDKVIMLYKTKYYDANFKHFQELLVRNEDINISYSPLYSLLTANELLSPKARRLTKREYMKRQKEKNVQVDENLKLPPSSDVIIPLEFAHPRQERCKYFGESIQMDASQHLWFGDKKAHLHLAIDNATS